MIDTISPVKRSWNMSRIRSNNTSIEFKVNQYLKQHKIYLRKNLNLPGKPDFASVKYKIVLFVNGCFWHQHGCSRSNMPKSNIDYWQEKLAKNKLRDINNIKLLKQMGYIVFTAWECEINKNIAYVLESFINYYEELKEIFS